MTEDYEYIVRELGADNQAFAGKTVLLTGSQGFLGRLYQEYFKYLNKRVLDKPVRLLCADNLVAGTSFGGDATFAHLVWDISQEPSIMIRDVLNAYEIDYLINAAGLASPRVYLTRAFETLSVSVQGTMRMLELCRDRKIGKSLFFSSSEVYGSPDLVPTPETYVGRISTHTKRSAYDLGKMCIQTLCDDANEKWGINAKVVVPFNVFAAGRSDGRVIPGHFESIMNGRKMQVFAPGDQTRTFCWFSDFLIGSIKVLLHSDGFPVNIGNDLNEVSMLDLARRIEKVIGMTNLIEMVEPTAAYIYEPRRRCPDLTKARTQLGYSPKVSLDEALARFWEWAKEEYPKT
jgi:UDP-glucuronate decarboxylase